MEKILTTQEAEDIMELLPEKAKAEIKIDKIRFGEYFIAKLDNVYFRINPLNVVIFNGRPKMMKPDFITEI